jgi:hypothetical protein
MMLLWVLLACAVGLTSAATPGKSNVRKRLITALLVFRAACYVLIRKLNV